ncbi:unnamed protein product [Spirodela intermedia]|uniref:Uncharacterized protein n=1 Tax=Spirodela intermedia TaxID=51605 RepID=A0A7I8IM11_SPIIN|nr:unnamed protein product [Spirodela intermedia]CAA6658907.1 unnamed protein product [Spirodela intermedia]
MPVLCFVSAAVLLQLGAPAAAAASRSNLEIVIGGPPYYEPSPPPEYEPCPPPPPRGLQPSDFENLRQYKAYLVIQRFKKTITCDPLGVTNTWKGPKICKYRGFTCDTPPNTDDRTIAGVDFNGFTLAAPTICGFADGLPDLAFFHSNTNNFSGTVPDLSRLPFLFEFDISNNRLGGPFPDTVIGLKQVVFLDLRYNGFFGRLPPSVFSLDLDYLFLNNNPFNTPIPKNVGRTSAAFLTLANNGFTGSIPSSIGNAAHTLEEVLFLNNRLSGCLPYEIGLLRRATVFDAGRNSITGPIPLSFGCLKKVEQLNLANNRLFGRCRTPSASFPACSTSPSPTTTSPRLAPPAGSSSTGDPQREGQLHPRPPKQKSPEKCAAFFAKPKRYCPNIHIVPCETHQYGGYYPPTLPLRHRSPPRRRRQRLTPSSTGGSSEGPPFVPRNALAPLVAALTADFKGVNNPHKTRRFVSTCPPRCEKEKTVAVSQLSIAGLLYLPRLQVSP